MVKLVTRGGRIAQLVWRQATGWTVDESGFDYRQEQQILLVSKASGPILGATQSLV
jgi:hypothetical protein